MRGYEEPATGRSTWGKKRELLIEKAKGSNARRGRPHAAS